MGIKRGDMITVVGLLFLAIGLFNPANLLSVLLVDTTRPTFSTTGSYPSSTDINAPSIITQPGTATSFWVLAEDENGIDSVVLRCKSTDNVYDSGAINCFKDGTTTLSGVVWDIWKWNAPALADGKLYAFTWLATDVVGNENSIITYGGCSDVEGYFTVNGVQVTSTTQTIKLATKILNVAFTVTKLPEGVQNIRVVVKTSGGSVLKDANLDKISDTSYKTDNFYTFTADGSYIIEGYIVMSTKSLRAMSIFGDTGVTPTLFSWPFSPMRTLFMAMGALVVVYARRIQEE